MSSVRKIEFFSAGCPLCNDAEKMVLELACSDCKVEILAMNEPAALERARELGVESVPAVAIDGKLASCCDRRGIDAEALKAAGIGKSLSS
jgi:glutaredoxin